MTIVTNHKTGQALGRMSMRDALGWVDAPFASTFRDTDEAREVAISVFGRAECFGFAGDIQIVAI